MKRCPSFCSRPGFPAGLQVLVLDHEISTGLVAEAQLKECGYSPVICVSSQEAIQHLANPSAAFDLLLLDVQCLHLKTAENSALLAAAKTLPLVLMSSSSTPAEIMMGIKQGAVDFMEKPLHMQKLQNIWQHVVRKLMSGAVPPRMSTDCDPVANLDSGAASAANSVGRECASGAGESGSNVSSSECANMKQVAMELDPETSSLVDAVDNALGNPLAGLASGFSHLLMGVQSLESHHSDISKEKQAVGTARKPKGRYSVDLRHCRSDGQLQHTRPARSSAPGNDSTSSGADNSKPVIGHSAGQLPPTTAPGMAWGLPTNPLHISPKVAPMVPMPMSMPWLQPMMMPPGMGMMMPPMFGPGMGPAFSTMMPAAAKAAMPCNAPAAASTASVAAAYMKRVDSMPHRLTSCADACDGAAPQRLLHSISSTLDCAAGSGGGAGLLSAIDCAKPQQPPIGLQLRKSMSLIDMISASLKQAVVT